MKTKKLVGIVMACMLVIASMSTAFAASKQDVLDALGQGVTLKTGETYYISAQDMQTAKNYLAQEDLSSEELDDLVKYVETVRDVAKDCDSIAELKADPRAQYAVETAATIAGVTVAINYGEIVVSDSSGRVLATVTKDSVVTKKPSYTPTSGTEKGSSIDKTSTSAIKQTGADINLTNMMIVISSTIVMLASTSFVAFKFKLLKD